ncbi:MAG: TIGR04283 family arsenosugar biosynthesis glycosyltransferase [Planctomycetota bacterium]
MNPEPASPFRLSVIIPTLNEEVALPACVHAVLTQENPEAELELEILVVDGGSADQTVAVAQASGVHAVLESPLGRGQQLARGASLAKGDVLLFLHADCILPPAAFREIHSAVMASNFAGAFSVQHVLSNHAGPIVRRLVGIADKRSRKTSIPYGDQAVFVTAAAYAKVGGMPQQPLMEDLEFAQRLSKLGRIAHIPHIVKTSARRFEQRPIRSVLCWWSFPTLYRWGVSAKRLMWMYGHPRASRK